MATGDKLVSLADLKAVHDADNISGLKSALKLYATNPVIKNGVAFRADTNAETAGNYQYAKYKINECRRFVVCGRSFGGRGKWPMISYLDSTNAVIQTEILVSSYNYMVSTTAPANAVYIIVNGSSQGSVNNDPTGAVIYEAPYGVYADELSVLKTRVGYSDTLGVLTDGKAINTNTLAQASSENYKMLYYVLRGEKKLSISGWSFGTTYTTWVFVDANGAKVEAQPYVAQGFSNNEIVTVPSSAYAVYVNGFTNRCPPIISKYDVKPRYVFIGDSYSAIENNWVKPCADALGIARSEYITAVVSGSGFANQNQSTQTHTGDGVYDATVPGSVRFIDQLLLAAELVEDKEAIQHVVVCGGYNDSKSQYFEPASTQYVGDTVIEQHIAYFVRTAIWLFPNAIVHVGMVAYSVPGTDADRNSLIFGDTIPNYQKSIKYGAHYLSNVNVLADADMSTDNTHPNATGAARLGLAIANAINTGSPVMANTLSVGKQIAIGGTILDETKLAQLLALIEN